jgi:hypothetical protein
MALPELWIVVSSEMVLLEERIPYDDIPLQASDAVNETAEDWNAIPKIRRTRSILCTI